MEQRFSLTSGYQPFSAGGTLSIKKKKLGGTPRTRKFFIITIKNFILD